MSPLSRHRIHIEKLLVDGVDLAPEEAEDFKNRLVAELKAQLSKTDWLPGLTGMHHESLSAETREPHSEKDTAGSAGDVAASVAETLKQLK